MYVKKHWDSSDTDFQPPEISEQDKQQIKGLLPRGLNDSNSKIRTAIAMAIASIAHWEWPDKWPSLIQDLTAALNSPDVNLVKGCIRCLGISLFLNNCISGACLTWLEMFADGENFSDQHLPMLVQFLLPTLLGKLPGNLLRNCKWAPTNW